MASSKILCLIISFAGLVFSKGENEFSLLDELKSKSLQSNRLTYEDFTEGIFTVPGYGAKETEDTSEPPFYPSPECGDKYMNLTEGAFGTITSPNYPKRYTSSLQCEWIIESIPGTVVETTFFDVVTQPWLFGFSDSVMISNTGNFDHYRRFAGDANHKMPFTVISKENRVAVRLITSRWLNFRGFKLSYVVRTMKPSDESPPENEYGSAYNNDLVAICNSKPIASARINTKLPNLDLKTVDVVTTIAEGETKPITKIVNGIETLPHQYPFMVAILSDESFFCGGSLIDSNHVLTAAHCVDRAEQIDLIFGVYNLSNRAENLYARQFRRVQSPNTASNVFVHPNYNARSGANDIAIVRVNPVKITKYVQPIFLPSVYTTSTSFSGWSLKTLGWGGITAGENVTLTPVLRQAGSNVITTADCRREFDGAVTGNNICTRTARLVQKPTTEIPLTTSTFAPSEATTEEIASTSVGSASDEEEDVEEEAPAVEYESPCHGDSGGPLFAEFAEILNNADSGVKIPINLNHAGPSIHECVNAKPNGEGDVTKQHRDTACQRPKDSTSKWYVQVGVLSFGSQVCGHSSPVAFTRVTAYSQWIAYIIGRHG